jgi:hypothetical protein
VAYKRKTDRPYNIRKPGDRFGSVTLIEKAGPGIWACRCDCGNEMRIQAGALPGTKSCGKGSCNHQWTEIPTYLTAHSRVRRAKGNATEHACEHCGSPANAWAYDHKDPDEFLNPEIGSPYSGKIEHYVALCGSCHREDDNAERRALRQRIKELEAQLNNIRPACARCNSETGGATRGHP